MEYIGQRIVELLGPSVTEHACAHWTCSLGLHII